MSVFVLKIIAATAMLIDHFGAVILLPSLDEPWLSEEFYMLTRNIGRIAFPIYAYLIAQGCVHTKNIGKYLFRLGLLAILSEPFFDMAFWGNIDFLRNTNIFYTLFLGAAAIAVHQKAKQIFTNIFGDIIGILAVIPMASIAWWLSTDYAHFGVAIIFLIYIMRPESRTGRIVAMLVGMTALYFGNLNFMLFSFAAATLIALYNGKLGLNNAPVKWGFYFFYPVHIAALIAARAIFL